MMGAQTVAQRGAAVVMALFVVVLCTLAVSPLVWNLFATAKTIAVAQVRDQADAIARSGLDWARVILREDARISVTDTLTEPWAVPLAASRISENLIQKQKSSLLRHNQEETNEEATLAGHIEDAQGRFNLRNLGADHANQKAWLLVFERLCDLLSVPTDQRNLLVQVLSGMWLTTPPSGKEPVFLPVRHWDEFRGKYDISEETWNQLRPYVVILPKISAVNANTASAEVLYATLGEIDLREAQYLLAQRERLPWRSVADIRAVLNPNVALNNDLIGLSSHYFLVEGTTQVKEALTRTAALLERRDQRVYVMWSTN